MVSTRGPLGRGQGHATHGRARARSASGARLSRPGPRSAAGDEREVERCWNITCVSCTTSSCLAGTSADVAPHAVCSTTRAPDTCDDGFTPRARRVSRTVHAYSLSRGLFDLYRTSMFPRERSQTQSQPEPPWFTLQRSHPQPPTLAASAASPGCSRSQASSTSGSHSTRSHSHGHSQVSKASLCSKQPTRPSTKFRHSQNPSLLMS